MVAAITNDKLMEVLTAAKGQNMRVRMLPEGPRLILDSGEYEIDLYQAEVMFSTAFGHWPAKN